jgi:hypothetical protein
MGKPRPPSAVLRGVQPNRRLTPAGCLRKSPPEFIPKLEHGRSVHADGLPQKTGTSTTRLAPDGYAPAAGKLAAAMATISASRRPIRYGALRSNELIRRMVRFPSAPARTSVRNPMAHREKWG